MNDIKAKHVRIAFVMGCLLAVAAEVERVTVLTRELSDDDVIRALRIAPGRDYGEPSKTFNRMITSLQVNDRALHR